MFCRFRSRYREDDRVDLRDGATSDGEPLDGRLDGRQGREHDAELDLSSRSRMW